MVKNPLSTIQIVDCFKVGLFISVFLTFNSNHRSKKQKPVQLFVLLVVF